MADPRERLVVCKLERYELEDRYLRLLEEVRSLKKLSNGQEDKIKRLATKLARFGSNPRNCLDLVIAADDQQDRLSLLEAENAQVGAMIMRIIYSLYDCPYDLTMLCAAVIFSSKTRSAC